MSERSAYIADLVSRLTCRDAAAGCGAMNELLALSREDGSVYAHMDGFLSLLSDRSSYVRTRALLLIAANARWDAEGKIDRSLPSILSHITDDKPITSRQFIAALPELAEYKRALRADIVEALQNADTGAYAPSMRPLVDKDIVSALKALDAQGD